jgi:DNA-binding NtrC family response regulator
MSKDIPSILLVEDEEDFREKMYKSFGKKYRIVNARTEKSALQVLQHTQYDLILLDLSLDRISDKLHGLELIGPIKAYSGGTPLVVVTKHQETQTIVNAMKAGADNYIRKDQFDITAWEKIFNQYIEESRRYNDQETDEETRPAYTFIGNEKKIQKIKDFLRKLSARPDITVLLTGETGVGKEIAARYLHQHGKRKEQPFKAVNLSVITESLLEGTLFGHRKGSFTDARKDQKGAFEEANGGVLFLDEIGDINHDIQVKLLRFLENKIIQPVGGSEITLDIQIVAATNKDLKEAVANGHFRSDLYYRLNQVNLEIPPLRERGEDIDLLIDHYLKVNDTTPTILSPHARQLMKQHHWPGNVRELVNLITNLCFYRELEEKDIIDIDMLPEEIQSPKAINANTAIEEQYTGVKADTAKIELQHIEDALRTNRRKGDAAEALGWDLDKLKYNIKKWNKEFPDLVQQYPEICTRYKL